MTLVRWRPVNDLFSIHNRINRFFDDEIRGSGVEPDNFNSYFPATDIFETKDGYVFKLEVPGLKKEDVNIEFDNNTLTVKGERKDEKEVKKEDYHRTERFCGTFTRSFVVPRDVNPGKIEANMKDGILTLQLPKAEEKKAKAIPINVN